MTRTGTVRSPFGFSLLQRAVVALGIAFVVSTLYSSWRIKQRTAAGANGGNDDRSGRGNG